MAFAESAEDAAAADRVTLEHLFDVREVETAAEHRIDPATLQLINGGAGGGERVQANVAAWKRWALRSRALRDVSALQLSTTVLGVSVSLPVLLAPSGQHELVHPEGEVATARAARDANTIMVLSMGTSRTIEDVAAQGSNLWLQLYWGKDRGRIRDFVVHAVGAGIRAICLTVDMPVRPSLNGAMQKALAQVGGTALPYLAARRSHLESDAVWDHDPALTWKDLEWLRSLTDVPILLKGIMSTEDARLAVEHGMQGIIVSNHGGRVLEDAFATADVLRDIAEIVDRRVVLLVDGGIRRGADVLKALALGARAVLIGRPVLWGLAVGGTAGVERVLDLLRRELVSVMGMTGTTDVAHIDPEVIAPRKQ